ncbi:hypothetical protein M441DRAFT_413218 [Trichoderma asperellum CBS 433.97]|uniref:Secreted protein n=1 Tax=Trichoderma asperellum (strain ATCC 204424 / CBS 433.97 / NBRC 101777) TaxID=1042311 RepID=A0A2T3Z7R5_TRIA4|nr:hypothetical protein M441DRAFT_413218 [Trichoderma asperellum CBS 433.97]PTB40838.1 hypothetical protein M441DRAFT_413218 [Trichoderma asperellum CBS 433.97]
MLHVLRWAVCCAVCRAMHVHCTLWRQVRHKGTYTCLELQVSMPYTYWNLHHPCRLEADEHQKGTLVTFPSNQTLFFFYGQPRSGEDDITFDHFPMREWRGNTISLKMGSLLYLGPIANCESAKMGGKLAKEKKKKKKKKHPTHALRLVRFRSLPSCIVA